MSPSTDGMPRRSVLLNFKFLGISLVGSLTMAGLFVAYAEQEDEREHRRAELVAVAALVAGRAPSCASSPFSALVSSLAEQVRQLADGKVVFTSTETWRTVYEQLLQSPGLRSYRLVAWVKVADYWQDQSTRRNYHVIRKGLAIERIVILRGPLWLEDAPLPSGTSRRGSRSSTSTASACHWCGRARWQANRTCSATSGSTTTAGRASRNSTSSRARSASSSLSIAPASAWLATAGHAWRCAQHPIRNCSTACRSRNHQRATLASDGTATFTTAWMTAGSHAIVAVYSGDGNFATSSSAALNQTVIQPETTTTLHSSTVLAAGEQPLSLTATVSTTGSGTPTGLISFYDGTTLLGTAMLSNAGTATFTTSSLGLGTCALSAVYSGDRIFAGSSSAVLNQAVGLPSVAVSLTTSGSPAYPGQAVTFTARVTSTGAGNPTGSVFFFTDYGHGNQSIIGIAELSGDTAALTMASLDFGSHAVTAVYGGDSNFAFGTSPVLHQTVQGAATAVTVRSAQTPAEPGQPVTLQATVDPLVAGAGTPTGFVNFYDQGGQVLLATGTLSGGAVTVTLTGLSLGNHGLSASYSGDRTFASSTGTFTQRIAQATTTTSLTTSGSTAQPGQPFTLTATVGAASNSPGAPTGIVSFYDAFNTPQQTQLGVALLSHGSASLTLNGLHVGSHRVTAIYGGDNTFATSSSTPVTEVVTPPTTSASTTTLTSSASPSPSGQAVAITVTVSPASSSATPSGSVALYDQYGQAGQTLLGAAVLNNGTTSFTLAGLGVGIHSLTAVYSGDSRFADSTSAALVQAVTAGTLQVTTRLALTSSGAQSSLGQPVVLTAALSGTGADGIAPAGSVAFFDVAGNGATSLGTVALLDGIATLTVPMLAAGSHGLVAVYGGDRAHAGSTSAVVHQVVGPDTTSTTLSSSGTSLVPGQSVTFSAAVLAAPGTGVPTGVVSFYDNTGNYYPLLLVRVSLSGGSAAFSTSALGQGSHQITAVYSGDGTFAGSSTSLPQGVTAVGTTTALLGSASSVLPGQTATFTATVSASSGTASGVVLFYDSSGPDNAIQTLLGMATLNGNTATFSTSQLAAGSHVITAIYGGDNVFSTSSSGELSLIVTRSATTTLLETSKTSAAPGEAVTLTATVAPADDSGGTATGRVLFIDKVGAAQLLLGSAPLVSGTATLTLANLGMGSHSLSALYSGNETFAGSTSVAATQTVALSSSTITLISSATPVEPGQVLKLTAVVKAPAASLTTPSGMVSFFAQSAADGIGVAAPLYLGTSALSGGIATFSTSALLLGGLCPSI